jgi:hypothetical protein
MIHNPPSEDEQTAHFLLGLADLLELAIEWLRQKAHELLERVRRGGADAPMEAVS